MSNIKINWIPVKDQVPNKLAPGEYERVTFVTIEFSNRVRVVIPNRIQYGIIEIKEFDYRREEWVSGIDWRWYDEETEEWYDYETMYDCKIIAWSRDTIEPYKEEA